MARSPLGIIALFILLVYAISGIVCATWEPPVPEALVWFIVLFPVLVFLVFAWLVVEHHLKLYGPGDFADQHNWMAVQQSIAEAVKVMDVLQPVISRTALPPEVDVLAKLDQVQEQIAKRTGVDLSRPQSTKPQDRMVPAAASALEADQLGKEGGPVVRNVAGAGVAAHPDDPQKGRWGGVRNKDGFHVEVVSNKVDTLVPGIYRATLRVYATDGKAIKNPVTLHLHNTFDPPDRLVYPVGGEVLFPMVLWGSFTVGVEINEPDTGGEVKRTALEIDLADPDIVSPQVFKDT